MRKVLEGLKRNAYGFAAFAFLGVAVAPAILATQPASAALITTRSIEMSSSAPSETAQTYNVKFTTATASNIQGVVVHFCAESPIIGSATCTKPSGMTIGSTVGTVGGLNSGTWTGAVASDVLRITNASANTSVPSDTNVTIPISGFTNPDNTVKTFYARIVTYATPANATSYTAGNIGTHIDAGGVALSVAQTVNVSATVQETLTFCVSGTQPASGCATTTTASLTLGTGTPTILDTAAVYDGTVYYQLSTNAVGNTVVRIKSANAGLTSGGNSIAPLAGASAAAVAMVSGSTPPNVSAFGIRTATPIAGGTGTVSPAVPYNSTTLYGNDSTAITSTYGDDIATATGALLNKNVPLVFGATAGPTTPAGVYTNQFALIASSSY